MTLETLSSATESAPIEALSSPPSMPHTTIQPASNTSSPPLSTTSSTDDNLPTRGRLPRPKLGSRKSSGTMIIPRDSPRVEMAPGEEEYEPDDVRSMSPRRTSEVIEKLGEDARRNLIEQAKALRASLMAIVDRVEAVKIEHEKLEGGNKFLQSYIGELIQTSKITSTAPAKSKGKSRNVK